MKQCLLKLLRPLNAFLILSQCAAAYTQCAAAYTHCAAAYTHCAAAYTHGAAAYMLCAAAYMVKVRIKLTQSSWAGAGTELGKNIMNSFSRVQKNLIGMTLFFKFHLVYVFTAQNQNKIFLTLDINLSTVVQLGK